MFGTEAWAVSPPGGFRAATPGIIELRHHNETSQVVIDLSNWPALASVSESAEGASSADAELQLAVASILLEPLRKALEALGLMGVKVSSLRVSKPQPNWHFHTVSFRLGERELNLGLVHIADSWLDLLEQLVSNQVVPFPPYISRLTIPGRIELGARTINVSALESLRAGDVVLRAVPRTPDAVFGEAPGPLSVPIAWGNPGMRQLCCTARIDAAKLTLEGSPYMSRAIDNDNLSPAAPSNDMPVPIGELDLPVKIEIDTVSLPVAQLSALRAGYVLELPVPVRDAQVRLVAYGQTVAYGELVAVGEHIGVRILRMCNQSGPV